jgi:hypothetical protein
VTSALLFEKDGSKDQGARRARPKRTRAKLNAANEAVNARKSSRGHDRPISGASGAVGCGGAVAQRDMTQARLDQVKSGATQADRCGSGGCCSGTPH